VKLIVIDSITFNFRQDFEDMAGRTRLLAEMGQKLGKIAEEYDLAVWCPPSPFIHSRVHNNLLLLSLHSCRFFCMVESPGNGALHPQTQDRALKSAGVMSHCWGFLLHKTHTAGIPASTVSIREM
jgi:hypothetical protein